MKYHLKHIDLFVQQYVLPMPTIIDRFDDDFIQKLKSSIDIEFEKIRILIAESFYAYDEEKLSTRFIRLHQRRITAIMNSISEERIPSVRCILPFLEKAGGLVIALRAGVDKG